MRRYAPSDCAEVAGWYEARGERAPPPDTLPTLGLIVPGAAAGWLYRTDSSVCLLEGFVTNPAAPLRARHRAIGAIIDALIEEAKAEGFRYVVGMARSNGIASVARRRQFKAIGAHVMLTREA